MSDLFKEILPSILENKKTVPTDGYKPFVVNRALSYHPDCLFDANEMNLLPGLAKELQYLFFINSVRAMKRPFAKWGKALDNPDLPAVKMYFGYGDREALAALNVLTEDQLAHIRTSIGE